MLIKARKRLLQMHFESGVGHLGGNLSCLDSLLILYHEYLGQDDRFVLSKGHSAGSLYIVLWSLGVLDDKSIKSFHQDGTLLAGHPPPKNYPRYRFCHWEPRARSLSCCRSSQEQYAKEK